MNSKQASSIYLVLLFGFSACSAPMEEPEVASKVVWPTDGWARSSPEAEGISEAPLDALDEEFRSGKHGYTDGMLVIRNGYVVYEKSYTQDYDRLFEGRDQTHGQYNYYDPEWHPYYKRGPLHTMQSVTKSVMSALIGIAIGRGEIAGVDVEVSRYFEDFEPADQDHRRRAMKLRDLLTMTSGITWDETTLDYTDPKNSSEIMEGTDDWLRYVLDQPMAASPGEQFVYNSGVAVMLAHILWKATGKHADTYAVEQLFGPLGIESFYWKKTPTGLIDASGGLYLRPRDLAKFGYLYFQDGVWEGKRILPEGWVTSTMTRTVDPFDSGEWKYGFLWWLIPYGGSEIVHAYACIGYGGQILLIVPEYDLIAVFTGWNIYDIPALTSSFALESVLEALKPQQ